MKFRYSKFGQNIRPVIQIQVKNKNEFLGYEVLVDSGADFSLFHTELAVALGIDVEKGKRGIITGVGGKSSEYFLHTVDIEVGGWPISMEVGFLPNIGGRLIPYGIVGQKGFFENFVVKFDLLKEEVELKRRETK